MAFTPSLNFLIILIQIIAFWPVWYWLFIRLKTSPGEALSLISVLTALTLLYLKRRPDIDGKNYMPSILFMLVYIITFHHAPPLIRALLAISTLIITYFKIIKSNFNLAVWGLLLIGLPVIPTIQFYLGYPLRTIVAYYSALFLNLLGYSVVQCETALNWAGQLVAVDAPCSGIKMLWSGWYLCLTLAALQEFKAGKTFIVIIFSTLVILFGNILRATSLFFIETKILAMPNWAHDYIGLISFFVVSILIYYSTVSIGGWRYVSKAFICNGSISGSGCSNGTDQSQ